MSGLYYPQLIKVPVFGTLAGTTRTSVPLTAAYTGNRKVLPLGGASELVVNVLYTTGASETGTTLDIQLENSNDGTNFYHLTNESASAGTSTLTDRTFVHAGGAGATTYSFSYRIDVSYVFLRISVQEAGVVTNLGTIYSDAVIAGL